MDTAPAYPAEVLHDMRAWIADCTWADLDPDLIATLSDAEVVQGVRRWYVGGVAQFITDGGNW